MWSNYFKHSKGDKFHSCSVRLALAMFLGLRLGLFWLLYVCKREEGYDFTLNGTRSGEMCICLALYVKSGDVINHCCFTLMELVLFIMFAHWKLPVEWLIQKAATGRGMKPLYNSCYFNRSEWKHISTFSFGDLLCLILKKTETLFMNESRQITFKQIQVGNFVVLQHLMKSKFRQKCIN